MKRFSRDESGVVTIEFALLATSLFSLMVGVGDFGAAFATRSEVYNGARAGAQLALVRHVGASPDTANAIQLLDTDIKNAVAQVTGLNASNIDVALKCACPSDTGLGDCATLTCTTGNRETFVTITTHKSYKLLLNYPGIGRNMTFVANNTVRLN